MRKISKVFEHILVPYNDTTGSQRAFKKSVKIAAISGAKVTVLTCIEEYHTFGFFKTKASKREFEKERKFVEKQHMSMKNFAEKHGVSMNSKIAKNGVAGERILEFADKQNVDLIIMGKKKSPSHYEKMHYHSTIEAVFRNTRCPILIV